MQKSKKLIYYIGILLTNSLFLQKNHAEFKLSKVKQFGFDHRKKISLTTASLGTIISLFAFCKYKNVDIQTFCSLLSFSLGVSGILYYKLNEYEKENPPSCKSSLSSIIINNSTETEPRSQESINDFKKRKPSLKSINSENESDQEFPNDQSSRDEKKTSLITNTWIENCIIELRTDIEDTLEKTYPDKTIRPNNIIFVNFFDIDKNTINTTKIEAFTNPEAINTLQNHFNQYLQEHHSKLKKQDSIINFKKILTKLNIVNSLLKGVNQELTRQPEEYLLTKLITHQTILAIYQNTYNQELNDIISLPK